MGEIKKYTDIVRLGHRSTSEVLCEGDHITITEKIDGANSSFILNENNEVDCFSRNTRVDEKNTLRGYYGFIQDNIIPIKNKLNPKYRYYGEWLCSHSIQYKPEYYNNFYLFNVYDEELQEYLSDTIMRSEAERLGIKTVPLIYEGEYQSFEHLMTFVGKSDMALTNGEGIVVKNVDYKDKYGHQMFVKLVHDDFREVQKQKAPKNPNPNAEEVSQIKTILTKPRVEKLIHKLVDEGIIPDNFGIEDMGLILKNLGVRLYEDMMKEESEFLSQFEDDLIKRTIGKNVPNMVKEIINT